MSEVRFCANCGHELTDGAVFCPYCGTKVQDNSDPVSRGAVYERIDERIPDIEGKAIWEGNTPLSSSPSLKNLSRQEPSQMTCFKCGSLIPANSTYCPVCQVQLFVDCPKCGNRYSAQYPSCNKCGTNREAFLKWQKEQKEEEDRQRRSQEEARQQYEIQRQKEEDQKKEQRSLWPVKVVIVTFALLIPVALVLRSIIGVGFSIWLPIIISVIGAVIIAIIWDAIERSQ